MSIITEEIQAEALRRVTEREAEVIKAEQEQVAREAAAAERRKAQAAEATKILAEVDALLNAAIVREIETAKAFVDARRDRLALRSRRDAAARVARRLDIPVTAIEPLTYNAIHGGRKDLRDFLADFDSAITAGW